MLHRLSKNISENKTQLLNGLQNRKIIHQDKNVVGFRSISRGLASLAAPQSFSRGHDEDSMMEAGRPAPDHCLTSDYL